MKRQLHSLEGPTTRRTNLGFSGIGTGFYRFFFRFLLQTYRTSVVGGDGLAVDGLPHDTAEDVVSVADRAAARRKPWPVPNVAAALVDVRFAGQRFLRFNLKESQPTHSLLTKQQIHVRWWQLAWSKSSFFVS